MTGKNETPISMVIDHQDIIRKGEMSLLMCPWLIVLVKSLLMLNSSNQSNKITSNHLISRLRHSRRLRKLQVAGNEAPDMTTTGKETFNNNEDGLEGNKTSK